MKGDKVDMDAAMAAIQRNSITMDEFNRLNCLHVLESRGHEIFAPGSIEFLAKMIRRECRSIFANKGKRGEE